MLIPALPGSAMASRLAVSIRARRWRRSPRVPQLGQALHLGRGELGERFVTADEAGEERGHHGLLRGMQQERRALAHAFGLGEP